MQRDCERYKSTQLGSKFTIGSVDVPLPIHVKVIPIDRAFADSLWSINEQPSIGQKRTHLERALRDYAVNKNAQIAPGNGSTIMAIDMLQLSACLTRPTT